MKHVSFNASIIEWALLRNANGGNELFLEMLMEAKTCDKYVKSTRYTLSANPTK